jgi:beta-lactamase regulating signal transducer with metallopeptidase domain
VLAHISSELIRDRPASIFAPFLSRKSEDALPPGSPREDASPEKLFDEALTMWVWLDRLGPILFDAALSTAIFLSLVVLGMLVCRQPSRRRLIARVAILSSLAMIPLVAVVPLPRLDLVDALVRSNLLPPFPIVDLDPTNAPALQSGAAPLPSRRRLAGFLHDSSIRSGVWLPRTMALLDLVCVATGFAWLLLGFWGVRWLIRHSSEPSASTSELYGRLMDGQLEGRAAPALRVSTRVQHPVVVGIRKPTILIPPSYDEPETKADAELLRLGLLHEIAHAEQSDPWFGTAANLAQTVWFFLPQIWWLRSQLLIDQEFLADSSAAFRYGTSSEYAASLFMLAEARHHSNRDAGDGALAVNWLAGGKDAQSPFFQRMLMLLNCPFRVEARAPRSWSWSLRLTVLGLTIAAACLCVRWPDARALESHSSGKPRPMAQPFRVANFVAEPISLSTGGRALPYVMPLALPTRFELSVEVLANSNDLAKVEIAGHPLGPGAVASDGADQSPRPANYDETWHSVRLKRDGRELSLWVDGETTSAVLKPESTSEWLTFEPGSGGPRHFRNLVVK